MVAAWASLSFCAHAQNSNINHPYLLEKSSFFKTSFNWGELSVAGTMAVKFVDQGNFRVSIASGMGGTLLDLEWIDGNMEIHFIPEVMNKKMLLKQLEKDLSLTFLAILHNAHFKDDYLFKNNSKKFEVDLDEKYRPSQVWQLGFFNGKKKSLSFFYKNEKIETVSMSHKRRNVHLQLTNLSPST